MLIQVKDLINKIVYSNNMSEDNRHKILAINFCDSYTQVTVQNEVMRDGDIIYPEHDIILPPLGSIPNWVDLIAINDDNHGEWVK